VSGTSSANLQHLKSYSDKAKPASSALRKQYGVTNGLMQAYLAQPSDFRLANGAEVMSDAGTLCTNNENDDRFVATVHKAFVDADAKSGQAIDNGRITAALTAAHVNAAPRHAITVDEPVFAGHPLETGWSDDPVCTATGHFVEVEHAFTMPEPLDALRWTMTYSSRFIRVGAHGRGWASWADAGLQFPNDIEVAYVGPDGQRATFVRGEGGFGRTPGVEAALEEHDAGYVLRWDWNSRFPGQRWEFDAAGRVGAVRTAIGRRVEFTHESGRLAALTDQGGRTISLSWNDDRIESVQSSDGRVVRFAYAPDLVEIQREVAGRRFVNDEQGRMLELFDADGVRLAANTYDAEGRVLSQVSAHGRRTTYRYFTPNTLVVADDDGGPSTLYRHDEAGHLVHLQVGESYRLSREFDREGNPVVVMGAGGEITRREFDQRGNCVLERRPDGASWTWEYDEVDRVVAYTDPNGAAYRMTYDGDARRPARVDGPLGLFFVFGYTDGQLSRLLDADGVTTTVEYDADGNVTAVVDGVGNRTELLAHASGEVSAVTSADGATMRIERDAGGQALRVTGPDGAVLALERTAEGRVVAGRGPVESRVDFEYSAAGSLRGVTDARGVTTELSHDRFGWIASIRRPGGSWALEHTPMGELQRLVDPSGGAWEQSFTAAGVLESFRDPTGNVTTARSDPLGRIEGLQLADGTSHTVRRGPTGQVVEELDAAGRDVHVDHDVLGRAVEVVIDGEVESRIAYTAAGRPAMVVRPDGATWAARYDAAGRLVETEGPNGAEAFERDALGRVVTHIRDGEVTRIGWGTDGRVATYEKGEERWGFEWDPASGQVASVVAPSGAVARSRYDERGDLVESIDPAGGSVQIGWDDQRNPIWVEDPKGARWSVGRDPLGRITASTDPLGRVTRLALDPAGRVTEMAEPTGRVLRFEIDADGRPTEISCGAERWHIEEVPGGRTVALPSGGRISETHDHRGRPTAREVDGAVTRWSYAESIRTVTPAAGAPYDEHLDLFGRVVRIEHPVAGTIAITRDLEGRPVMVEADGLRRTWTYDGQWLTRYEEQRGDQVHITELERDLFGRVAVERTDGVTSTYEYDLTGQLVGREGPGGAWRWVYDACGRLVDEVGPAGRRTFEYDAADQLVRVEATGGATDYHYDGAGRRVSESGPDGQVEYQWDGLGRLAEVTRRGVDGTAEVTDLTLGYEGEPLRVGETAMSWAHVDGIGLQLHAIDDATVLWVDRVPVATVDRAVSWVAADWRGTVGASADPWGSLAPRADLVGPGFLGELQLGDLVWLRNRVYDPTTHAFLTRDPFAGAWDRPGGPTNPYQYAGNDPIGHVDPLGLHPVTVDEANKQIEGWKEGHWKQALVIAGCVVVGGVLIVASGGSAAVIMAAAGGALLTGGTNAVVQYATTGKVDWWKVGTAGAAGFAGGAFGAAAMPLVTVGGFTAGDYGLMMGARYGIPFLAKAVPAAAEGGGGMMVTEAATELGNEGQIDPTKVALYGGLGAGGSVGGEYLSNAFRASRAAQAQVLANRAAALSWWKHPIAKGGATVRSYAYNKTTDAGESAIHGGAEIAKAGGDGGIQVAGGEPPGPAGPTTVSPSGVNWQFSGG
jgi:RHS repeat-associated protein